MTDERYPSAELKYFNEHDWVRVEGDEATFGITWFAQDALGEIVYGDLPTAASGRGRRYLRRARVGQGRLGHLRPARRRGGRRQRPARGRAAGIINEDPYGDGWIVRVRMSDRAQLDGLMDADAYRQFLTKPDRRLGRPVTTEEASDGLRSPLQEEVPAMLEAVGAGVDRRAVRRHPGGGPAARRPRPAGGAGRGGARGRHLDALAGKNTPATRPVSSSAAAATTTSFRPWSTSPAAASSTPPTRPIRPKRSQGTLQAIFEYQTRRERN